MILVGCANLESLFKHIVYLETYLYTVYTKPE